MHDRDVRTAVRKWLAELHADDEDTRVVEEMGIWAGTVRIDVAVINGELQGYELKSERDTLVRLPRQAEFYNAVFDRVTIVLADRHAAKALPIIPEWWGVKCATVDESAGVELRPLREAVRNPAVDPLQLARLLWRDEALDV